jgi:hypothetical protein
MRTLYAHRMFLIQLMLLCLMAFSAGTVSAQSAYTAEDKTALTGDDPDAIAEVLFKLSDIYSDKGADALEPVVPDLITAVNKELALPEDERWNIYDIVKIMSLSGDVRVRPLLLTFMSVIAGGGNPYTAQGLYAIGPDVIPAVRDSLISTSSETRGRAAVTLHKMAELDTDGSFFSDAAKSEIRAILLKNLTHEEASVRIYTVVALRSFGDQSVIDSLRRVEKTDAHKDSGGTYEVRVVATETLKHLAGE